MIIAFSETEELGNNILDSFHAQQRLIDMIRTYDLTNYESNTTDEYLSENSDEESFEIKQSSPINNFIKNI